MTNKDISETLLNYMQTLWPMDGWVRNKKITENISTINSRLSLLPMPMVTFQQLMVMEKSEKNAMTITE